MSEAPQLYQALVTLNTAHRSVGIIRGVLLHGMKKDSLYQEAVGSTESWSDFLKMPEIGMSVSEANREIDLYEVFSLKHGFTLDELKECKTKSLHYLLPIAKSEPAKSERIGELVDKAKHLTQNQFREEVQDVKTGGQRTYEFVLMRRCVETGSLQKVHDIDSDMIKAAMFESFRIDLSQKFMPEIL